MVALFAVAGGFTLSGIAANSYRLISGDKGASIMESAHLAVLVVAGPSVLLENAVVSFRKQNSSGVALWLTAAVAAYWSFVLGLFLLNLAVVL